MENKNSSNTTYWDEIGVCWCFLSDWCVKALIWFSWLENERKLIFRSGSCPHPQQLQHLVLKVWVERVYNTSSGSVLWLLRLFHPALLLPANPEPPPAPNPASCTLIIIPIQSKYKKCTPITANHNVKISGRSKQEDESAKVWIIAALSNPNQPTKLGRSLHQKRLKTYWWTYLCLHS